MPTPKLSIVLIDDHVLLTQSLTCLLEKFDFISEIRSFENPRQYLAQENGNEPDIILSEIVMPEMTGIELLLKLENSRTKTKIIILSSVSEVQTIRHAIRTGASGYLSKNISADELKQALLTVYHGEPYVGESLRKKLVRNALIEDRFLYNLSPREKEVLNYVCMGKTIKEAAFEMQLSSNTVQTYYKSILKKFNLHRTADLIVFAIQNGLYSPKNTISY